MNWPVQEAGFLRIKVGEVIVRSVSLLCPLQKSEVGNKLPDKNVWMADHKQ